jgi:hypothetical protein
MARFLHVMCARFDDGWCWSPESTSPPTWQGPFASLGAAEEDARIADGRVAGSTTRRKPRPSRQRRHEWEDTIGLGAGSSTESRRCAVCHLEQTRTSALVLWPNSGFCPGPARLVTPKR